MRVLNCDNAVSFPAKLEEAKSLAGANPLIVLFTGAIDSATGKSWCPDCTAADPIIHDIIGKTDSVLLSCAVIREEYRNPEYVYRTAPDVKLKCVPTVSEKSLFCIIYTISYCLLCHVKSSV
jgi:hypothetical protein